jgi:WD40 repeat protein
MRKINLEQYKGNRHWGWQLATRNACKVWAVSDDGNEIAIYDDSHSISFFDIMGRLEGPGGILRLDKPEASYQFTGDLKVRQFSYLDKNRVFIADYDHGCHVLDTSSKGPLVGAEHLRPLVVIQGIILTIQTLDPDTVMLFVETARNKKFVTVNVMTGVIKMIFRTSIHNNLVGRIFAKTSGEVIVAILDTFHSTKHTDFLKIYPYQDYKQEYLEITNYCLSRDGKSIITADENGGVYFSIIDAGKNEKVILLDLEAEINFVKFSHDERFIAVVTNTEVNLFDTKSLMEVHERPQVLGCHFHHTDQISDYIFHNENFYLTITKTLPEILGQATKYSLGYSSKEVPYLILGYDNRSMVENYEFELNLSQHALVKYSNKGRIMIIWDYQTCEIHYKRILTEKCTEVYQKIQDTPIEPIFAKSQLATIISQCFDYCGSPDPTTPREPVRIKD